MILHVGIDDTESHIKLTSDVDCLGCEVHEYQLMEVGNYEELFHRVDLLEWVGYTVCVDTEDCLYETDEGTDWYI